MRIGPPRTERDRVEALRCLLSEGADTEASARLPEVLALFEAGAIDVDGLIVAWEGESAKGAGFFQIASDGSAFVWPPTVPRDVAERDAVAKLVLSEMLRIADGRGCPFAQSVVDPDRVDERRWLESAGFRHLADVLFLQRPLDRGVPRPGVLEGSVVTFSESEATRFAAVVEATFAESRDCPAFAQARTAADAIGSYRSVGEFTPQRWRLVERAGRDIAVVLVNDRSGDRAREVVYLGVVPQWRRSGLGRALVTSVLHEASDEGYDCVLTSVDSGNRAALALYRGLGFFAVERRSVFIRRPTS